MSCIQTAFCCYKYLLYVWQIWEKRMTWGKQNFLGGRGGKESRNPWNSNEMFNLRRMLKFWLTQKPYEIVLTDAENKGCNLRSIFTQVFGMQGECLRRITELILISFNIRWLSRKVSRANPCLMKKKKQQGDLSPVYKYLKKPHEGLLMNFWVFTSQKADLGSWSQIKEWDDSLAHTHSSQPSNGTWVDSLVWTTWSESAVDSSGKLFLMG